MAFTRRRFLAGIAEALLTAAAYVYAPAVLEKWVEPEPEEIVEEMYLGGWFPDGGAVVRIIDDVIVSITRPPDYQVYKPRAAFEPGPEQLKRDLLRSGLRLPKGL